MQIDVAGNVLARLPGRGSGYPLIVSAHLDTVFPLDTDLTSNRSGDRMTAPGIGDNSLGVAALFGILWQLRELKADLSSDVWFAANVCEEGLGDLRGMRAVVERFGGDVKGYLVLEGMAFGHVYNRGTGVRRYKIAARTAGGHSWSDYGKPSAIHELSGLVTRLAEIKLPASPRTTLNVGRITGGTSINTIAPEAQLELDLRSEDESILQGLVQQVDELVAGMKKPGVDWEMQAIGNRPAGFISAGPSVNSDCVEQPHSIGSRTGVDHRLDGCQHSLQQRVPGGGVGRHDRRRSAYFEGIYRYPPNRKGVDPPRRCGHTNGAVKTGFEKKPVCLMKIPGFRKRELDSRFPLTCMGSIGRTRR